MARTRISARPTTSRSGCARTCLRARSRGTAPPRLSRPVKVRGKELSFNNLLDLDSGRRLVNDFELPAAAIIKHNNPCGAAVGGSIADAYERALASDPQSAYGGVVVLNREIDAQLAKRLSENFIELLFAPGYTH